MLWLRSASRHLGSPARQSRQEWLIGPSGNSEPEQVKLANRGLLPLLRTQLDAAPAGQERAMWLDGEAQVLSRFGALQHQLGHHGDAETSLRGCLANLEQLGRAESPSPTFQDQFSGTGYFTHVISVSLARTHQRNNLDFHRVLEVELDGASDDRRHRLHLRPLAWKRRSQQLRR